MDGDNNKSLAEEEGFKVPSAPASKQKTDKLLKNISNFPALKYTPPDNASVPKHRFTLEVIKDGEVVEQHEIGKDKTFFTFGRLPICDFPMEHGSISRYHAVLQFTDNGSFYIHDLKSSHGTLVNKVPVVAGIPRKIEIGDQIRFGVSSRIWVMCTLNYQLIEEQEAERHSAEISGSVARQTLDNDVTIELETRPEWGINNSSDDDNGSAQCLQWKRNPDAAYWRDPVKYLKKFLTEMNSPFEPEILSNNNDGNSDLDDDPEFITRKQARSNKEITVRIALPVDGASGKPLYGIGQGLKKKEAERLACLDALEELDKNGVLSLQDNARPGRRAKRRNDRNESDDEFDDEFYDRTQTKVRRKADNKPETFESLSEKLQMAEKDIEQIQRDINKLEKNNAADSNGKVVQDDDGDGDGDGDGDELDAYMYALEKGQQASEKKQLETRLAELEKEKDRLIALIKLVAPDEPVASKKREDHSVTQAKRVAETREPVSDLPKPKRQRQSHGPTLRQIVESQKEAADKDPGKTSHIGGQEALTKRIEDDKTVEWQPPAGQTGDGRTSLNDKLGY